jgi:hypothetical protein
MMCVVKLNVTMLSVVMLSVVVPKQQITLERQLIKLLSYSKYCFAIFPLPVPVEVFEH